MEDRTSCFLKSKTLTCFAKKIVENGLKQAYLFSSDDSSKNYAFCKILSMFSMCKNKNMCLNCDVCKKILNDNSVDLLVYPKSNAIVVDDIKEIVENAYVLPLENEFKIFILNDFDLANSASQNKFLKTLEEPPQNVIFLLNTTKSDMILNTIKSRCEKIILPKFSTDEFIELLKQNNVEIKCSVVENSDNEFGNYISLLNSDFEQMLNFCIDMLENMKSSSEILNYSSKILKFKDLEYFFKAMLSVLMDINVAKIDAKNITNKSKEIEICRLCEMFSKKSVDEILKNLINANKELSFNTNVNLVVDCILIDILEEKHKWN